MDKLIPVEVDFKISTTDLVLEYRERNFVKIIVDIQNFEDFLENKYCKQNFIFDPVAEIICVSLNFYESRYGQYTVLKKEENLNAVEYWAKYKHTFESGFYMVDHSDRLASVRSQYDPKDRLGLKHYVIVGNDSYIELIASDYQCIPF